jgi:large subunit ribosomal protein L1
MAKKSKRYIEVKSQVDNLKLYDAKEAIDLLKKIASDEKTKAKFTQSVDIAFNLNLKAKHTVRDTISLPYSTSTKEVRVLVFAKSDKAKDAEEAGADFVGDTELIEKVKNGFLDFDVAIATNDMMKEVKVLGRILGSRGLMPNSKVGTVTNDIKEAVKAFKKGKVEYRADKTKIVHLKIGRDSMKTEEILENMKLLYQEIMKKRPQDLKGEYIKSISLALTMGPGVKISHQSLVA